MTVRRAKCFGALSICSILFSLVAIFAYSGPEFTIMTQGISMHECHDLPRGHTSQKSKLERLRDWYDEYRARQEDEGRQFIHETCEEIGKSGTDYSDSVADRDGKFTVWQSRLEGVKPQMWSIYIEALGLNLLGSEQDGPVSSDSKVTYDLEMVIRGKNSDEEAWTIVYDSMSGEETGHTASEITLACETNRVNGDAVCDAVEVGIIGILEFKLYDILVLASEKAEDVSPKAAPRLSFQISHLNDSFLSWFAIVRLSCLLITAIVAILYFIRQCSRRAFKRFAVIEFSFEQHWVIVLLLLCITYDEPFFEFRRTQPSIALAILGELPSSVFFTTLLTYWLMGLAYVRVKARKLQRSAASFGDIVGAVSLPRMAALAVLCLSFAVA